MVSENVFHQRGIILLYRTSNLIIQSVIYGKFRISISILHSSPYVLRDLCIAYPSFDTYNDVSYLFSFWANHFNQCEGRKVCTC